MLGWEAAAVPSIVATAPAFLFEASQDAPTTGIAWL